MVGEAYTISQVMLEYPCCSLESLDGILTLPSVSTKPLGLVAYVLWNRRLKGQA